MQTHFIRNNMSIKQLKNDFSCASRSKGWKISSHYCWWKRINPLTAKLFNWNFHPLEVVARWRDPQLQVSENYSDLTKWRSTNFKSCWLMSLSIFNMFKSWYVMCFEKCKKRIWTAPAVKGLTHTFCVSWLFVSCHYRLIGGTFLRNVDFLKITIAPAAILRRWSNIEPPWGQCIVFGLSWVGDHVS